MKLIEKKASDFANNLLLSKEERQLVESAHKHGFQEAREMADKHSNQCCGCPGFLEIGEEEVS